MAHIEFTIAVANTDETFPEHLPVNEIAIYIAKEKAEKIASSNGGSIVIAADTIVYCNNKILGKPTDRLDAINMLLQLAGNTHQVITGVCIVEGTKQVLFADITTVEFHELSKAQIEYYVDNFKPFDKAGGYAIQEWIGAVGIKKINGDFYNVMGLPISRVVEALKSFS
jgi:septum formation protein